MFGCGNRDGGNGDDDGGIGVPATQGGSESQGAQGSGSEGTTSSGGDIELPPETGGETGDSDGAPCESFELDLKPQPTNLMLVIDRSGSMVKNKWDHDGDNDPAKDVTRWFSLHGVVDQVTAKFDGSINFGAQIYPGASDKLGMEGSCAVADAPQVTIQEGAREKILAAIPAAGALDDEIKGATPTYASYTTALTHLKQVDAAAKAASAEEEVIPPAMVLITDGGANCSESYFELQAQIDAGVTAEQCDPFRNDPNLTPISGDIREHCVDAWYKTYDDRIHGAVEAALTEAQIKTYVIGIGIEDEVTAFPNYPVANSHEKLNDLAIKGGTPRDDENTKYFKADNQDSLLAALDEIAASVASCAVPLETPIPPAQAPFVELSLKGKGIPFLKDSASCEGKHGWRWTSEAGVFSSLELCGESCQELKLEAALDVVVGCEPPA